MKNWQCALSSGLLLLATRTPVLAQPKPEATLRRIEVTGMAEKEIVPDQLFLNITLREYRDGKDKVLIGDLEQRLRQSVRKAGLADDKLRLADAQGYQNYWTKKKDQDFMATKQYVLELRTPEAIGTVLAQLDSRGIAYTNVGRYWHSQMEQLRRETRVAAMRDAQQKAEYLLEAVGSRRGELLEVSEQGGDGPPVVPFRAMRSVQMEMSDAAAEPAFEALEFQKIKLRYDVRAVFRIE